MEEVNQPSSSSLPMMLKFVFGFFFVSIVLSSCISALRSPTPTPVPTPPKVAAKVEKPSASNVFKDVKILPAPEGDPVEVATKAISYAGHRCDSVAKASRMDDGSIGAICRDGSNFLRYRVATARANDKDVVIAMNCEAAKRLGVDGC